MERHFPDISQAARARSVGKALAGFAGTVRAVRMRRGLQPATQSHKKLASVRLCRRCLGREKKGGRCFAAPSPVPSGPGSPRLYNASNGKRWPWAQSQYGSVPSSPMRVRLMCPLHDGHPWAIMVPLFP